MSKYQAFIFESYDFDAASRTASLRYSYDGEVHFTEQFQFQFEPIADYRAEALDRALRSLWLMAGVSYYKAFLPDQIVVRGTQLSPDEAAYFARNYQSGLGEFLYRNKLDVARDIHFPATADALPQAIGIDGLTGSLVALGGGKDSLVSVDILSKAKVDFVTWTVRHTARFAPMIVEIGHTNLAVERRIDPGLHELIEQGAYNGHVPITGILILAALVSAILGGKANIIFSNEASAEEPTLVVDGFPVNHQFSKTMTFERDLQRYIADNISPDLHFFSLLRPLTELRISELFAEHLMDRFAGRFSSCNRNFTLHATGQLTWCGECPKCCFVFLMFAPFVAHDRLIEVYGGKNPLANPELHALYDDILGLTNEKPFDCVGETAEARLAVRMAQRTGEWQELDHYQLAEEDYDYRRWHESAMPDNFLAMVREYAGY